LFDRYINSETGKFRIGDLNLGALMKGRETPFYVYSGGIIREKINLLKNKFPGFDIFYSFKPNPNFQLAEILRKEGAHAEISSGGELRKALDAGFAPENIIFVSPAKTEKEIELAVRKKIYSIVVDSRYELELVDKIASSHETTVNAALRINTLEGPKDAPEIMVGGPGKFGFDEENIFDDLAGLKLRNTVVNGIQVYAGSQILDERVINEHIENVFKVALKMKGELGIEIRSLDFGGGFGVPYLDDETELDLELISKNTMRLVDEYGKHWPDCRYIFEIGRYLVAECGIFVTRVLRIKESRGTCFLICDGGMNNFTRMAFMRVKHPVTILNKIEKEKFHSCMIAGPCCTPLDIIGDNIDLPEVEVGDIIGVFNAGAYGYSMSMHDFISFRRPKEYLVDGNEIHEIG